MKLYVSVSEYKISISYNWYTKDPPQIVNDRSNRQPDYMTTMDRKIDLLAQSNCNILNVIKNLELKIDNMIESCHSIDERSAPKHTCDYMETLEIMTKLNAIDQNIQSINGMQSNRLECNNMQANRKCVSANEREQNNVNQVSFISDAIIGLDA